MNKSKILNVKIFSATSLSIILIFLTWEKSYSYHCSSFIFPGIMLLIISHGYIELKMQERNCFRKCYFQSDTFIAKLLSSRIFVTIFFLIVSISMTVSTFIISLGFPKILWLYFVLHVFMSLLLFNFFKKFFSKVLQKNYEKLFAREWTVLVMAVFLVIVYVMMYILMGYTPEYLSDTLPQTIKNATGKISSNCKAIDTALYYSKMVESSFWWILSESTEQMNNTLTKSGIWLAFLFYNSLGLLGINRFIIQIIYLLSEKFDHRRIGADEG